MADDLTFELENKWDTAQLLRGGVAREVTKIRYYLGKHGPFEETFDRNPSPDVIERAVRVRKDTLERLSRL